MSDILASKNLSTLTAFASSSVLLGFDFDGTLAPIVSRPRDARMRRTTYRLLADVARRYPCVVISGRTRADLVPRLGRVPLWGVIGNYGREPWAQSPEVAARVQGWVQRLRAGLGAETGVVIENKTYSVTIHYRHALKARRIREAIAAAVRPLSNVRALASDHAVNLIPRDGVDKGTALQRVRCALACDTAIFVGDDESDEDAFASAPRDLLLGIRVGKTQPSRARFHLRSQTHVDEFLQRLVVMRSPHTASVARQRR